MATQGQNNVRVRNDENVPPTPAPAQQGATTTTAAAAPNTQSPPRRVFGNHNGTLGTTIRPQLPSEYETTFFTPGWPFGGPREPLRRTRIVGEDELVFGTF
ncbi:hypothetical protein C8Q77DRAFT_1072325 [Trametes polyzona]|nr:hypothetical protein C8Q77DRAFT_1072325 [Trametes polyzona]